MSIVASAASASLSQNRRPRRRLVGGQEPEVPRGDGQGLVAGEVAERLDPWHRGRQARPEVLGVMARAADLVCDDRRHPHRRVKFREPPHQGRDRAGEPTGVDHEHHGQIPPPRQVRGRSRLVDRAPSVE